ncbi:MAG TPA: polysaccharide deacetylase family protein [Anaerolineales bacterium]|nr:polysaccharide deacetylase family protein [Anaerolineales bacterium]
MTTFPRRLLGRAAPYIPLGVYRRLMPRGPVGFFYHVVSDHPLPHQRHLFPYKDPAAFETDLRWLAENTTPLDYAALAAHLDDGAPLPPNGSSLSFDDGLAECFTAVRPLLKKHDIPCIFFLTTDWIDNRALFYRGKISLAIEALTRLQDGERERVLSDLVEMTGPILPAGLSAAGFIPWLKRRQQADEALIDRVCVALRIDVSRYLTEAQPYLTTEQIAEMRVEGFVFGAHTRRHAKLATLPPEEQAAEIVESCRIVAELTGERSVPFAFPFSGTGVDRNMLRDLRRTHTEIGPIFDTLKLRREPGILHRIWADKPVPDVRPEHNLEFWFHDAYRRLLTEGRP